MTKLILEPKNFVQPTTSKHADTAAQAIETFQRDSNGKRQIRLTPQDLYAFGYLIRVTETMLLDQFGQGLLSGTTHRMWRDLRIWLMDIEMAFRGTSSRLLNHPSPTC